MLFNVNLKIKEIHCEICKLHEEFLVQSALYILLVGCFRKNRISSNKRRGAYLIFVILAAALNRGRRLFQISRFQISKSMDLIDS